MTKFWYKSAYECVCSFFWYFSPAHGSVQYRDSTFIDNFSVNLFNSKLRADPRRRRNVRNEISPFLYLTYVYSSMAACRAVMRLLEFNSNDVYIHSISAAMAGSNPPVTIAHHNIVPHINFQKVSRTRPEVRVTTEHITMSEFP